jgi:hypothetical protein
MFFALWRRVRRIFALADDDRLRRRASFATRTILLYPIVYVFCTLPAVIARLKLMTGRSVGYKEFTVVGVTMCSNGWMDAILYSFTRRSLILGGPIEDREVCFPSNDRIPRTNTDFITALCP